MTPIEGFEEEKRSNSTIQDNTRIQPSMFNTQLGRRLGFLLLTGKKQQLLTGMLLGNEPPLLELFLNPVEKNLMCLTWWFPEVSHRKTMGKPWEFGAFRVG